MIAWLALGTAIAALALASWALYRLAEHEHNHTRRRNRD